MERDDYDGADDYEDFPEEIVIPDWMSEDCRKEIADIPDPEIRKDQIEREEKLHREREELTRKSNSGEIDDFNHLIESQALARKETRLDTLRGLRSVGLGYDQLGELSEEWDIMVKADPDLIDANDRVNDLVKTDPASAQKIDDRMLQEGRLPEEFTSWCLRR